MNSSACRLFRSDLAVVAAFGTLAAFVVLMAGPAGAVATIPKVGTACATRDQGKAAKTAAGVVVCTRVGTRYVWTKLTVGTASTVTVAPPNPTRLILSDVFTSPDSGWPSRRSDALDVGYQGTRSYGITVRGAQQFVGASSPIKTPLTNVTVNVEARIVPYVGGFSVGCYDTGTSDVRTTRYDALIGHDDKWVVSEFRNGVRTTVAAGDLRLGLLLNGQLPNKFSVRCTGEPGGPGTITVGLNGTQVSTVAIAAMLPAGNVSLWAYTNATTSGTQILWDNFSVSTTA